jgi:Fic family protein
MNETITLNPRQKAIITLMADGKQYSRESIAEKLSSLFPTSKATLARDLAELVEASLIQVAGAGPSTMYQIKSSHPLLAPLDLDFYFSEANESTRQPTTFNPDLFSKIPGIFSTAEINQIHQTGRNFDQSTQKLDPTIVERELERFLIELSWKSSQIEGNTYSLLETETLIKQQIEAAGKTKAEAIMILNHKDAFKIILDQKLHFRQLDRPLITQLHQALTKDMGVNSGTRQHAVGITGSLYRPPDNQWQLDEYLNKLIDVVNATAEPLEKAVIILAVLAKLQAFTDGNKRTARMLSNAVLLAYDLFPLSYRSVDINQYKQALIVFYETDNLYHFKQLFLDQYRYAQANYFV